MDHRRVADGNCRAGRRLHAPAACGPEHRGHRCGDRRSAVGGLRRGRESPARPEGRNGADDELTGRQTLMDRRTAVIAIGGNSLIKDRYHQTVRDQYIAARETCRHIVTMIKDGWRVAITHGNGPQVGFILRRSELAAHELHELPLDVCGADTQGAIGYALQQNLQNAFMRLGMDKHAATVVTQVEVAADDPAFQNPSKPIGSYMDEETAKRRQQEDGWSVAEDAGRGWRRVVASPVPIRIVEEEAVKALVAAGQVVITVGGGGIPV